MRRGRVDRREEAAHPGVAVGAELPLRGAGGGTPASATTAAAGRRLVAARRARRAGRAAQRPRRRRHVLRVTSAAALRAPASSGRPPITPRARRSPSRVGRGRAAAQDLVGVLAERGRRGGRPSTQSRSPAPGGARGRSRCRAGRRRPSGPLRVQRRVGVGDQLLDGAVGAPEDLARLEAGGQLVERRGSNHGRSRAASTSR